MKVDLDSEEKRLKFILSTTLKRSDMFRQEWDEIIRYEVSMKGKDHMNKG